MGSASQGYHVPQVPKRVTYAFYLILGSIGIRLLNFISFTLLFWQERYSSMPVHRLCWGLSFLIDLWFAFKIRAGRNWARWIFVVSTAFLVFELFGVLGTTSDYSVQTVFYALSTTLSLAAIFLLFRGPANEWFRTESVIQMTLETASEEKDRPGKLPKGGGLLENFFTDKAEAPSVAAFVADWQGLQMPGRVVWIARIALFAGIIISLFLPWYLTDAGEPGSGWILGLDLAGWSCGVFFLPTIAVLLFGAWTILRPGGRIVWAYRVALIVWLAYTMLSVFGLSTNYSGPIVSLAATVVALVVETIELARGKRVS